jgi:hypothetical protein
MFTPFNCSALFNLERFELLEQFDPIGDLNALRHHSPMY